MWGQPPGRHDTGGKQPYQADTVSAALPRRTATPPTAVKLIGPAAFNPGLISISVDAQRHVVANAWLKQTCLRPSRHRLRARSKHPPHHSQPEPIPIPGGSQRKIAPGTPRSTNQNKCCAPVQTARYCGTFARLLLDSHIWLAAVRSPHLPSRSGHGGIGPRCRQRARATKPRRKKWRGKTGFHSRSSLGYSH